MFLSTRVIQLHLEEPSDIFSQYLREGITPDRIISPTHSQLDIRGKAAVVRIIF